MAKDKKENESMNGHDEFAVRVGEKIRSIREALGKSMGQTISQQKFYELLYPAPCSEYYYTDGAKTNRVSDWERGKQGKYDLTAKDIYAIARVAGITPSELLNVDIPYKVKERHLTDWFKTLFLDMPKAKCFKSVDWYSCVGSGDARYIHITISLPLGIYRPANDFGPAMQEDSIESREACLCADALNAVKDCYPLSVETKEEQFIARINQMETNIAKRKEEQREDYIPF